MAFFCIFKLTASDFIKTLLTGMVPISGHHTEKNSIRDNGLVQDLQKRAGSKKGAAHAGDIQEHLSKIGLYT